MKVNAKAELRLLQFSLLCLLQQSSPCLPRAAPVSLSAAPCPRPVADASAGAGAKLICSPARSLAAASKRPPPKPTASKTKPPSQSRKPSTAATARSKVKPTSSPTGGGAKAAPAAFSAAAAVPRKIYLTRETTSNALPAAAVANRTSKPISGAVSADLRALFFFRPVQVQCRRVG